MMRDERVRNAMARSMSRFEAFGNMKETCPSKLMERSSRFARERDVAFSSKATPLAADLRGSLANLFVPGTLMPLHRGERRSLRR